MRLIDADNLYLGIVEKGQASKRYKIGERWELNCEEIREVIDAQPTADAVEVVRCKDCRFFKGDGLECHSGMFAYEDDYCSNGERKEANG